MQNVQVRLRGDATAAELAKLLSSLRNLEGVQVSASAGTESGGDRRSFELNLTTSGDRVYRIRAVIDVVCGTWSSGSSVYSARNTLTSEDLDRVSAEEERRDEDAERDRREQEVAESCCQVRT